MNFETGSVKGTELLLRRFNSRLLEVIIMREIFHFAPGAAIVLTMMVSLAVQPADAQGFKASYGKRVPQSLSSAAMGGNRSRFTSQQRVALRPTGATTLSYAPQVSGMRNGLPPTRIDSFVLNAGADAELIYGDESSGGQLPPYMFFTEAHRINNGIRGERNVGLTTGHGSVMPDAWGRDEFLGMPEQSQSGEVGSYYDRLPIRNLWVKNVQQEQFPEGYADINRKVWLDEDRMRTKGHWVDEHPDGFPMGYHTEMHPESTSGF